MCREMKWSRCKEESHARPDGLGLTYTCEQDDDGTWLCYVMCSDDDQTTWFNFPTRGDAEARCQSDLDRRMSYWFGANRPLPLWNTEYDGVTGEVIDI